MEESHCCSVCLCEFTEPVVLNCGHTFDKKCVIRSESCPLCRTHIKSRVTNWQLLELMERPPEIIDWDPDNLSHYQSVADISLIKPGSRIAYNLKTKTKRIHKTWFQRLGVEKMYVSHKGKTISIPTEMIEQVWVHPGFCTDRRSGHTGCHTCSLI